MVIDQTTGKGCAWAIASKTIAKKLIDDGIINRPISRKPRKNGYDLLWVVKNRGNQVYVMSQKCAGLADESLWTPSFIDENIWERAVNSFRVNANLDRNVERFLLPEMGEYLQTIPDSELISITRDFLIKHGVIHVPIRQRGKKIYYFNENEIYSLDKESELFLDEKRIKLCNFQVKGETCFNMNVWYKAASQFEVGATLEECVGVFLKTKIVYSTPKVQSPVDRLAQYISPPIFERVPGNRDEGTFDRIRVSVGLPRYQFNSWEALQREVKKYQREIYQRVLQKLEQDRQFKKYGVPVNFLKVSNATLLRDYSIEFIFALHSTME